MKRENIFICAIALFIYFSFGFLTQIFDNYLGVNIIKMPDVPSYIWAANNFFHAFKADAMRPLGYPIIIGLPFLFNASWGFVLQWGVCINAILWCATPLFIFNALVLFASKKFSMLFAIIYMLCIGNLEYAYLLLSENTYTCLLAAIMYFIALYLVKKNISFLAWAFVLFSFSMLVRPTLWPLYPFALLVCVVLGLRAYMQDNQKIFSYYYTWCWYCFISAGNNE